MAQTNNTVEFLNRNIKKFFISAVCVLLVLAGTGYLLKEKLWQLVVKVVTMDAFLSADTDSFDSGLPVGKRFPNIMALYQGKVVSDVREFAYHKGMVFIANRSTDW
jgi:hypothetical protein